MCHVPRAVSQLSRKWALFWRSSTLCSGTLLLYQEKQLSLTVGLFPTLQTIFPWCIPKIDLAIYASLQISSKYFQNIIIMFCLELWYSVDYKMQPFSCQHREQHISKQDYEISVKEIHFSRLEPQRFGIEVWLTLLRVMKSKSQLDRWIFCIYFFTYEKLKSFVKTLIPYNQIPIFKEQLCMSSMDFYHMLNIEIDLQSLFGLQSRDVHSCIYCWDPQLRIWTRITRALLVSKDRGHLLVTPWFLYLILAGINNEAYTISFWNYQ
jgi:hypothetical protein